MPPSSRSLPGLPADYVSKFFVGDVVRNTRNPAAKFKVLRSWSEEDEDAGPQNPRDPLDRPLRRGEMGISEMLTGDLSIVRESEFTLFVRDFLRGDLVKRSLTSVESAVIVSTSAEVKLEPSLHAGMSVQGWVPYDKLRSALLVEARDRVVYDEWIGTVVEVVEDGLVQPLLGQPYTITDTGGTIDVGRTPNMVFHPDRPHTSECRGHGLPRHANPDNDVIVDVKPVILFITWNAINQKVPIAEQQLHPEPKRFWSGADVQKLAIYDLTQHTPPQLAATVRFKTEADEREHVTPRWNPLAQFGINLDVGKYKHWHVSDIRTTLRLRWQDGSETEEAANNFVPYRNVDDYESWPGEHVMWRGEEGVKRPAVVQSFDPRQRVAVLRFTDDDTVETVPALELDPGGVGRETYGVSLGQQVMLCDDNGSEFPQVPGLGQGETPLDNLSARHELAELCNQHTKNSLQTLPPQHAPADIAWWGEVVDHRLNGLAVVRLANGEVVEKSVKELVVLNDPLAVDAGLEGGVDEWYGDEDMEDEGVEEVIYEDGEEGDDAMSAGSWETVDGQDGERPVAWEEDGDVDMDGGEGEGEGDAADAVDDDVEMRDMDEVNRMVDEDLHSPVNAPASLHVNGSAPPTEPVARATDAGPSSAPYVTPEDIGWERFEVLEEAPAEHHFYPQPQQAGSKAWMTRMQKEHRALRSSLPDNILVRTYEDRLDLMRVLIVGPEGTPYNDAPFVFDLHLDPTKFPNEPPAVHFHSHTNSQGRCNPNLYEEGKVCLSILGTWQGDKSESWSAQKSSLLQVFVSISGLVLVRSPYHCEPAFAKLQGTREGRINSRLYSEKAYVLSRSFVRTALVRPPASLDAELRLFYLEKGRLRSVIDHAQRLIDKSAAEVEARRGAGAGEADAEAEEEDDEGEEMWNGDAVGRLTMGAVISLRRTITALEKIWAEYKASSDGASASA